MSLEQAEIAPLPLPYFYDDCGNMYDRKTGKPLPSPDGLGNLCCNRRKVVQQALLELYPEHFYSSEPKIIDYHWFDLPGASITEFWKELQPAH